MTVWSRGFPPVGDVYFVVKPVLLHHPLNQVKHSCSEITISAMNLAKAANILSDELQIS